MELEEELKVVGNNMKSLEVSEQEVRILVEIQRKSLNVFHCSLQAMQREESYEEQIRDLSTRLKDVS